MSPVDAGSGGPGDGGWRRAARVPRRDVRGDVDEELRFHLEMRARELIDAGVAPEAAWAEAERRFGAILPVRDDCIRIDRRQRRRTLRTESLTAMLHDLRYALRTLRANLGFTTVAVLTLALGIGATTAIYSAVDGVLLRPLPFPHADRLVVPQSTRLGTEEQWNVTYRDFEAWREASVFDGVALYQLPQFDLTGVGAPVHTTTALVTPDFFRVLGVRPLLGRLPQPDEFRPDAERPLVLSYGLWQRQFGGRPEVVGSTVRLSGTPVTIVGVLPPGLGWPHEADLWYPMRYVPDPDDSVHEPDNFLYNAVAHLRSDRTLAQTRGQLAALAAVVARTFPAEREGVSVTVVPMRDWLVGPTLTRALWVLLGAVGCVLLIACVNVANLLLARGAARGRELALRTALGAARGRLVRQLLVESIVLAAAGGVLGIALAVALTRGLVALAPTGLPRLDEVALDGPVLAVAMGITLLSALLFGLVPALHASASSPAAALAEDGGTRASGGVRTQRTGSMLVVGEVALALVLLTGAGLLGRSVLQLSRVDPGLDAAQVLTFQAALPGQRYDSTAKALRFWDELQRRLQALPGVESASMSSALPVGGGGFHLGRTLIRTGAPRPPAGSEVNVMWLWATPHYFQTLGQPLLAGRDFTADDDADAPLVIVVSRAFARAMFPDRQLASVVGERVTSWRDENTPREIVGVVGDVRYNGAADSLRAVVYVPLRQGYWASDAAVSLRAAGDPATLTAAVRRELAALDADVAMARVETLDDTLADTMAPQRFNALLLGGFAVLAVLLAVVGLYGLLSYGVTQRARELSVRIALGATRGEVIRLVLGRSLRLLAVGIALGLVGSLALTRVLASLLFGVQPTDPLTFTGVTVVLLAVALLASYLPARRAARADPARTLRAT